MDHSHRAGLFSILPLYLLFVLAGAHTSTAQNETGRRVISRTAFAHHWYDSAKHYYYLHVPIIRTLPPLNTDMPAEVLRAYIHLDSLARFNDDGQIRQLSSAWVAKSALLQKTLASYYRAMDYDPLRYQQYDYETALKSWLFRSELGGTTRFLPQALAEAASIKSEGEALRAVLFSDYVLRIKVMAVDSMPTNLPFGSKYVFNVTAQVLDTIKGRRFITCEEQRGITLSQPLTMSTPPCLYFQHTAKTYADYTIYGRHEDSTFIEAGRGFALRPGQEMVAFLNFTEQRFDSTHDAFQLFLGSPASDLALPIIDGQVRDRNLVWSNQMMMNYADWKQRFLALRDKILTGTY